MHHLKTCIILPAYWDSQLYNIKALLQTHKRVSWEGLTLCHKEKGEQWEDGLRGEGHLLLQPNRLANNNEVKVFPARMKDTSSLSARSTRLKRVYHFCANAAFRFVCHVDQLLHGLMLWLPLESAERTQYIKYLSKNKIEYIGYVVIINYKITQRCLNRRYAYSS